MLLEQINYKKGCIQLTNLKGYQPFQIQYEDIGNDSIQLDVSGTGLLNYFGELNPELEMEIQTGILNALKKYGEITTHDATEIGYTLDFHQSKKLNRKHNLFETAVNLYIVFKKPVTGASAYSLQPTIELITATILAEAFILM